MKKYSTLGVWMMAAVLVTGAWWWSQRAPASAPITSTPLPEDPALSVPTEVIDQQWAQFSTYAQPKLGARTVSLQPGLPARAKDGLAPIIKPWLADAWLVHRDMGEMEGYPKPDWSVDVSSAAASLSGTRWDAMFVQLNGPGLCGSGGCMTEVLLRTDHGWTEVASLFGCDRIELLTTRTHGLQDIRYTDCPSQRVYVYRFDGREYHE